MTVRPAMFGRLIKSLNTAMTWQLKWDQIKTNFHPPTFDVNLEPMVKVLFSLWSQIRENIESKSATIYSD